MCDHPDTTRSLQWVLSLWIFIWSINIPYASQYSNNIYLYRLRHFIIFFLAHKDKFKQGVVAYTSNSGTQEAEAVRLSQVGLWHMKQNKQKTTPNWKPKWRRTEKQHRYIFRSPLFCGWQDGSVGKELVAKPATLSWSSEPTWQKERTDSRKLSSDRHVFSMYVCTYNKQTLNI